ncbi:MAG: TRIC cation channel family protein, partial [Prevotellamassilia sp.]|nr:TRIC cation channel family protein [Prevotellamassilia sp.]
MLFDISFYSACDYIGTLAVAISGVRLASAKRFDLFGAYIGGIATAIG